MEEPDFWDDPQKSQEYMKQLSSMKEDVAVYARLEELFEEIETLIELGDEENDPSLVPEVQSTMDEFVQKYDAIRLKTLLSGEYDKDNAIVTLHAGAGGQHINKTSSAIRITHIPTNIVVQCQNERSQFQNKDKAMQMLKAKLYLLKQQENAEKASGIRGEVKEIGWGNQIRSYVLQPYTMVKDHRTGAETGNTNAVLDGDIDLFINAYLKWVTLGESSGDNSDMPD